jgi:hypothetical protein
MKRIMVLFFYQCVEYCLIKKNNNAKIEVILQNYYTALAVFMMRISTLEVRKQKT